jgi:uncharacterized protein YbjT (DUF2867 family)
MTEDALDASSGTTDNLPTTKETAIMFTIFGATGNTASIVATELLAQGKRVRAVVRNPAKAAALRAKGAEIFQGDVLEPASIREALAGAEGAYLLAPPDVTAPAFLARTAKIVDAYLGALAAHPLEHAVLLSSVGAQEPAGTGPIVGIHRAEEALRAVPGTVFTFLRAAYFMENLLANAQPMRDSGVLPVFGGGETYAFSMVATKDIGLAAATALLAPPRQTEIIELSGPGEYSMVDAANIASEILGKTVKATAVPIDAMVPTLTSFGFSADMAGLYREMTEGLGAGLVRFDGKGRAARGKTPLREVLAAIKG